METKSKIKVSTQELLSTYRSSLLTLIPWIEKVGIPWKAGEAYDDWDNICQTLFQSIVANSILGDGTKAEKFAEYDLRYNDYKSIHFIIVEPKEKINNAFAAFVSFCTLSETFDGVEVCLIDSEFKSMSYRKYLFADCSFKVMLFRNFQFEAVSEFEIEA